MKWCNTVHGCMLYTEPAKIAAVSHGTSHVTINSSSFAWHQPCNNQTALKVHHFSGYSKCTIKSFSDSFRKTCDKSRKPAWVLRTVLHNSHQQQESLLRLWSTLAGLKRPADVGLFNFGSREPKLWRLILCPLSITSNYCIQNRCRGRMKDKNLKTDKESETGTWLTWISGWYYRSKEETVIEVKGDVIHQARHTIQDATAIQHNQQLYFKHNQPYTFLVVFSPDHNQPETCTEASRKSLCQLHEQLQPTANQTVTTTVSVTWAASANRQPDCHNHCVSHLSSFSQKTTRLSQPLCHTHKPHSGHHVCLRS